MTGSLNVIDVDGDKLIFNTLSGPTSGTVTYDAATATYAYTPTAAARKAAAQTEQEDYDHFTVRTFDGLGFTYVEVRVPISPAPTISELPIIRTPINVNEYPTDIAVGGTYAYVVNEIDAGTMVVIDPATNTLVGDPIPVGLFPTSVVASEQGDRVYVVDYGYYGEFTGVAVIDTDPTSPTYHEVTFVPVTVEPNPCGGEHYSRSTA